MAPFVSLDPVAPALEFFARYGLIALFVLLAIDSAGIPFPTELVIIMAVAIYATDTASLVFLVGLTTLAALTGSLILFGVCFAGGRRLVERKPRLFMMTPRRLQRLERVFASRVGQSLVFFLRLFPLTRVLVSIPAGIARMRPLTFFILTLLGMTIYHAALVFVAYHYGAVGAGAPSLETAAQTPAWQFIQANHVATFLAVLALFLLMSLRASRNTLKDPEWSSPSRIGWVAERVAVVGGLLLLIVVLVDVSYAYHALSWAGLDLPALMERLNWDPSSFLFVVAALGLIAGLPLIALGRAARRRKEEWWVVKHGLREEAEVFLKPSAGATDAEPRARSGPRGGTRRGPR